MFKLVHLAGAAAFATLLAGTASADQTVYEYKKSGSEFAITKSSVVAKQRDVTTKFVVKPEGAWFADYRFSNGHRGTGEDFRVDIYLLGADGETLKHIKTTKTVPDPGLHFPFDTQVKRKDDHGSVPTDTLAKVRYVVVAHNETDRSFKDTIEEIKRTAIQVKSAVESVAK